MLFGFFGLLLVVGGAFVIVRRIVTLPRRIHRIGSNIQSISDTLEQRQADKAAGKPTAPVNILGLAGAAVALAGVIVARTTDGLVGTAMLIIALGMMLIGFNLFKAKPTGTSQDSDRHRQVGVDASQDIPVLASTDRPTQNVPVDLQSPGESAAQFPASLPRPLRAASWSPSPLVKPAAIIDNLEGADPNRQSTTRSASPTLCVGGTARVISADKRFAGRIGQVVAINGQDVELKISGTFGTLSFQR